MVSGAVIVVLTGLFFDGTALPMIAAIALCAALTLTITLLTLRNIKLAPPADAENRLPRTPRKETP